MSDHETDEGEQTILEDPPVFDRVVGIPHTEPAIAIPVGGIVGTVCEDNWNVRIGTEPDPYPSRLVMGYRKGDDVLEPSRYRDALQVGKLAPGLLFED